MLKQVLLAGIAVSAMALGACSAKAAPGCADLAKLQLRDTRIDSTESVKAGGKISLGFPGVGLPAPSDFCRVQATLTPTPSSDIKVELWLPSPGAWNGKFLGAGNGGFGGSFVSPYLTMRPAVARGYAAVGSNLGHVDSDNKDAAWALNQPEKIKDFGYRSDHLAAEFGKAVVAAYYGSPPKRSYFQGCSDGGREALMEARRFPDDYEGVIAGAPANAWTHLMTAFAWDARAVSATPASAIPSSKLKTIQDAALAQCASLDPLGDGYLNDPRACRFDPEKLRCADKETASCLTDGQIATLRKIYGGPVDPGTGARIFPGYPAGGEATPGGWDLWITGSAGQHGWFAKAFFKDMVFNDPHWSLEQLDFDRDVERADRDMAPVLNSDDPDLSAFRARGGKLILFHGWSDAAIPPQATIDYYQRVRAALGEDSADRMVRLFMVPGMGHCLMGPGPNTFDVLSALEGWTERGVTPERITATKYDNDLFAYAGLPAGPPKRTRPLCAYPSTARYSGSGSKDDQANFSCMAPEAKPAP